MSSANVKVIDSYENEYVDDLILSTHSGETRFLNFIKEGRYEEIEKEFQSANLDIIVGKMSNDTIRQLR